MEMMEKLRSLDLHYADVEARLGAPETYDDPALVAKLNKEQRELDGIEDEIHTLETRLAENEAQQSAQSSDYIALQQLTAEHEELETTLEAKMERWLYLLSIVEGN